MKIDPTNYIGRGPALVKHTFILAYLPTLIAKIASSYDEFVYIDLFAGPWDERTVDFSDTAFGIAMHAMRGAKAVWKRNGRTVKMTAHLVETRAEAIIKQKSIIDRYPDIKVFQHHGEAENKLPAILEALPQRAFCFGFIDPKGVPDIRKFQGLIERPNSEIFLNFMFEFANRFAGTERMPTLEWLTEKSEQETFRAEIRGLAGQAREDTLTDRARFALARMGNFRFAPAITVDEENADRCLYKLIFLSRHEKGIKVFRDAQRAALQMQATNRTARKSDRRATLSGMDDFFERCETINPADRSAREIRDGRKSGEDFALELIKNAGPEGLCWGDLWPSVLEEKVITQSDLGNAITKLRDQHIIETRGWEARVRKPRDSYHLIYQTDRN